ncbi:aminopeptidase N [bacterium]|nr:MAG: aminopeptidase N [bacterium]
MHNNLTRQEARARAEVLSGLHYEVRLDLTTGAETFGSETTVTFRCRRPGAATFIEFGGPAIHRAELNGRVIPIDGFAGGRLPLRDLAAENTLRLQATGAYSNDGTGLNRFEDPVDGRVYLHSQFGEHAAYLGYACFDQPDLKATFGFTVKAPDGWVVVSNTGGVLGDDGVWTFPPTKLLSTYITALVAGPYHAVHQDHRGIPLGLYCRRSLARYLDPEEFFEITQQGLDFFARRFGHPYPFGKYDQLFVPEFSAGAMENAACVTFHEKRLFRSRVTEAERMDRAVVILHEMAHMWFGDLVTPRWWDDLWLNETFAEYMGYLGAAEATRFKTAWIDFATATEAGAKAQDQLPTTHPIVADIPDVESVTLNLDGITYNKGAAVIKQLVAWVGEDAFFRGVEAYFKANAYGNTDLADFLRALEQASGRDLGSWSRAWLEAAGVNTLQALIEAEGGRIRWATVVQAAPADHPTLRPHRLRLGLFDLSGSGLRRRKAIELDVDGAATAVPQMAGEPVPDLVLVNDGDLTYAKAALDSGSLSTLARHLRDIDDPLARALAWEALWDMVRDAQLRARDYLTIALDNIGVETDAMTLSSLIGRIERVIESFSDPAHRPSVRSLVALAARGRFDRSEPGGDVQLLWARALIRAARDPDAVAWVRGLLDGTAEAKGLSVDFEVRWGAVDALATIGAAGDDLIAAELERDPTDEGRRAAASARAAQPLAEAKQAAWKVAVDDEAAAMATRRAVAAGFHRPDQLDLLDAFVQPYFESLMPVWESHDAEEAISIIRWMYPRAVVTHEVVDATDSVLAGVLPGPVRRSLLESRDAVARALRAQAFDRS